LRIIAFAVAACMTASPLSAQVSPPKDTFAARLEQVRTSLQVDDQGLHGPGATVLADAIANSRYVLLGEDHLSREIPQFTAGVCRLMVPGGLDSLAVEIGPEAAHVVNANLRRGDRVERLSEFLHNHPDAFAFQNGRDESDMAAACAKAAGARFQIWGLDQEFMGASGYLLEQMLAAKPGSKAKEAIEELARIDRTATEKALASGSAGDLLIYSVSDQQLAKIGRGIRQDGGSRVVALFDALIETRAIYLGQNSDPFASNGRRARLMKRTLVHYLAKHPQPARVLFKFGDAHMGKGINGLGQRDLGNFVAERAEGEGVGSLHIAVYGAKGIHALYGGVGRQARNKPFVLTDYPSYAWLKDALPSGPQETGKDWTVIDFQSMRSKMPADMDTTWRDVARRYDFVVVAPELTPSSLLGTR
jgi:erythromycin esterase-like protein